MDILQITYEAANHRLSVTVVECKELKNMDTIGKSDPFVEVLMVPGKHVKMKTKVIKNNLNPVFHNEVFMSEVGQWILAILLSIFHFKVSPVEAERLTAVFRVFDWDHLKTSDKRGEVFDNVWKLTKKTNLFPRLKFHFGSWIYLQLLMIGKSFMDLLEPKINLC
jgi:hypothetical protein